jgi:hypothetical protein
MYGPAAGRKRFRRDGGELSFINEGIGGPGLQTDQYRLLAEENRVHLHLLPPLRGKIVDRFGTP